VDRSSHGSIRHVDTHVVQRPVEVRREPEHAADVRREVVPHRDLLVHHDVDVDIHRRHSWNDFAFGRRRAVLPLGFLALQIGGVPYYYYDGIYYQPVEGGYQEVYPPVGPRFRNLPTAPSTSMQVARPIITPAARSMCSKPTVPMASLHSHWRRSSRTATRRHPGFR